MGKKLIVKVIITINYVNVFIFNDMYKAMSFCELYTEGSGKDVKIELTIKSEVVEDDLVYSEPVPTKGVDC